MVTASEAVLDKRTIIVATGCPASGWEMIIPVLEEAGIKLAGAAIDRWYDGLFKEYSADLLLTPPTPFIPDRRNTENLTALLLASTSHANPCLIADSRNLWLLDFWAEKLPTINFLLFYTPISTAMAYAMNEGIAPRQFMDSWQMVNQFLIRFQTTNRQKTILVDAGAATQHPDALIESCRKFKVNLNNPNLSSAAAIPELQPVDYLLTKALETCKPFQDIQVELEARAIPCAPVQYHSSSDAESLLDNYQKYIELQKQDENKFRQEQEENELLLLQLHQMQEELESYYQKYQGLQLEKEHILQAHEQEYKKSIQWKLRKTGLVLTAPFRKVRRTLEIRKQINIIRKSGLFDKSWYVEQYQDIAKAKIDPIKHYYFYGAKEGRDPSTLFNTQYYLDNNPDVKESDMNPLLHYLWYGKAENRKPLPG